MIKNTKDSFSISSFSKKVIKATAIVLIMLLLTYLILKGFKVLLLVLAGILFATFFRAIAETLQSKLPINMGFSLALTVFLFVSVCGLTLAALYPRISEQLEVLQTELPKATIQIEDQLNQTTIGNWITQQLDIYKDRYQKDSEKVTLFFSSFFGGLADIYIIFFLGIFFTFQPNVYKNGIVLLFPKPKRDRANQVLLTIGYTLKRWMLGKFLSMTVVGILTFIGLAILDIPLALTLGLFAAIITFIPNFGPLISLIPAFLLACTISTEMGIYVCILYGGIQAVESNLITPFIQRKMISLPLAMILIAQVVLGIFTGILGLILAVPVVAIVTVLVKMVYIEDILNDKTVEVLGEDKFSA